MKCVLHIGTEKTGTTLLQDWLYANKTALSSQGVALSDCLGWGNNRKLSAYFQDEFDDFHASQGIKNDESCARFFNGFLNDVSAEISELGQSHDVMVISSEHFHSRFKSQNSIEALKSFLEGEFESVKIVCYFREQSDMHRSLYSTALKSGSIKPVEKFIKGIGPHNPYFNHYDMLSMWADVFGEDNIEPVIYDRGQFFDGDLRKDFTQRLGLSINHDVLSFDVESANEKLSLLEASILLLINRLQPNLSANGEPNAVRQELHDRLLSKTTLDIGVIETGRQQEIFEKFDESNRAFFNRFWGIDDNLFKAPNGDARSKDWRNDREFTPLEIELIDLIFAIGSHESAPPLGHQDVDVIRDVAMKYESGAKISKSEAISLMQIARLGRPHGPKIAKKLEEWNSKFLSD